MTLHRLGLMGGTFDPIHFGHLHIAEAAREALGLSQVVFVPNKSPVHKPGRPVSSAEDRDSMVRLAIAGYPGFIASRAEIDRSGPSYAVDTLRAFQPQASALFWIIGADTVPLLPTWHAPDRLAQLCAFVAVTRPGYRHLAAPLGFRVEWVDAPGLDVSASDIRERVRAGRSIKDFVPAPVEEYIRAHNLYQPSH